MVAYARFAVSELSKVVGQDGQDGRRRSDGRAGHLCHGPYITLGPGRYTAGFFVRRDADAIEDGDEDGGTFEIDVCGEHGRRIFASRAAPVRDLFASVPGLVHLDFALDGVERGCELRLHVSAQSRVEVSEAVLFRRDIANGVRR